MQFKKWLMLEAGNKAQMEVDPSVQPQPFLIGGVKPAEMASPEQLGQLALQGMRKYFNTVDPKGFSYAKERYRFILKKSTSNGSDGLRLTVDIIPLEKNPGETEIAGPDHPMHDYYQKYKQGKTGYKVYKTPKDAVEDIPADPNMAYRGISWEEWQDIRKTGFIASRGMYNLGQEGFTLFGKIPATALHYANSFAPPQYTPAFRKPGVVIAVPKNMMLTHKEEPRNIPDSELGIKGKLSKDHIQAAWMLIPHKTNQESYLELVFPYIPAWNDYKYKDPRTGFYKVSLEQMKPSNGQLATIMSYSIRRLV